MSHNHNNNRNHGGGSNPPSPDSLGPRQRLRKWDADGRKYDLDAKVVAKLEDMGRHGDLNASDQKLLRAYEQAHLAQRTVTVSGFSTANPGETDLFEVVISRADHDVTVATVLTGVTSDDVDGPLSFDVTVPTNQSLVRAPIVFKPQTLNTDKTGTVTLSNVRSVSAVKLGAPSSFTFTLKASPVVVVTPPPPPPVSKSLSGMNPDNSDAGVDHVDAIGAWRGSPVTCYTVFNWGHQSWDKFQQSYTLKGWTPARVVPILAQKKIVPICTIPGLVTGGNDLQAAAKGAYDHYHQNCANWLKSLNFQTEVVGRISRECNDPNQPFYYGADLATKKLWLAAHERIVGIYKDALGDKFKFSWCVMKRATGWEDAYPSFCDIVDIDAYLNTPVIKTQADFDKHWGTVQPHIDFAQKHGKPVAFSEWAIKDVDMPLGIQLQHAEYQKLAAQKVLHHENYFCTGPAHDIFSKSTKYPQSAAMYVKCYSGK